MITLASSTALDRIRIQKGYSLVYPARCMEAWVTHARNHQTGRISPLSTRFDVGLRGALGIGASYIAFYKRIRHIIQDGDLYRLQHLEEFGASVIQYVLPNGQEAVYSVAVRDHQLGWFRPPAPLKGLNPAVAYVVLDRHDAKVHRASGYELMAQGIPGDTGQGVGYSRTLVVKQI